MAELRPLEANLSAFVLGCDPGPATTAPCSLASACRPSPASSRRDQESARRGRLEVQLLHNSVMASTPADFPLQQGAPTGQQSLATTDHRAEPRLGDQDTVRRSRRVLGRRRPGVSSYRVFMTIVYACVVLILEWSDRNLPTAVGADIVGPTAVIVWALTLLGSFGIGPVGAVWNAMRR